MMIIFLIFDIKVSHPVPQGREDLLRIACSQLSARAIPCAKLGKLEIFKKLRNISTCNFRGFHQWTRRICDTVDAAVNMVSERVACVVLHVPDEDIVPVDDVE